MEEFDKRELHKRIVVNLLVTLLGVGVLIFAVPKLFHFFVPLIVAWLIASIANPMVRFLEKHAKILRKHGSAIVIVFVLLLVGSLLYFLLYILIQQCSGLIKELPETYTKVMASVQEFLANLHDKYEFIPGNIQGFLLKNNDKFGGVIASFVESFEATKSISAVGSFAGKLIDWIIIAILTLMISYFFVAQRDTVKGMFRRYVPNAVKEFWNLALDTCLRALGGYLKACFKIMLVVFAILLLIFGGVMRAEYAVVLALLTAVLDFFPFLGTGIVITPWAIYCGITGEYVNVAILIISYVVCLIAHRLLEPKLIGDSVGMSPFATLISMFICYRLIGMLGLIIGIPVGMIVLAMKEQGVFESQIRGIKILAKDISEYRKY